MLKILGLGAALIIIIATVSVGAYAYFNDVSTQTGNSISAGTLSISVNNDAQAPIALSNLKPGDSGHAVTWEVKNGGTLPGTLTIQLGAITETEGTPGEGSDTLMAHKVGDSTATGELGKYVKIAVWLDSNKNGTIDNGEKYILADGSVNTWTGASTAVTDVGGTAALYNYLSTPPATFLPTTPIWDAGVTTSSIETLIGNTSAGNFNVEYDVLHDEAHPSTVTGYTSLYQQNEAQGDSVSWDISFKLDQLTTATPFVTINQKSTQLDPTTSAAATVSFTAVFSEPVTDFATGNAHINLTGSTNPGPLSATVTAVNSTTYTIDVTGMSGTSDTTTVVCSITAGAAHDAAGTATIASISTDNTVTWTH